MKNFMKMISRLLQLASPFKLQMIAAISLGILGYLSAISVSIIAVYSLSELLTGSMHFMLLGLMIFLGIFRGVLRYGEQYANHYIAFSILAHIRHIVFAKMRELSPAKLQDTNKGDIISTITADIETLEVFFAHTISPVAIAVIVNGILTVLMFSIKPVFGITALCFYLLVGGVLPYVYYNRVKQSGKEYRQGMSVFTVLMYDILEGMFDIVSTNRTSMIHDTVFRKSEALQAKNRNTIIKSAASKSTVDSVILIAGLCILILGFYHSTMIETMIAFVIMISSFGPVVALAQLPFNLQMTFASAERLFKILDEEKLVEEMQDASNFDFESIELNNVSFSYDGNIEVLKNVSMNIRKNEIIGIKGGSGNGKSTILKLLLRMYDAEGVSYNGKDIKDYKISSIYDNVALFSQSTYVFHKSIRDNLKIANPEANDEDLWEALRKASAYEFVSSLPNGLDTILDNENEVTSLGEKQRLGLARIFLSKAKVILLDEPTSNIDAVNEAVILKSLKQSRNDYTMIIVSHKDTTLSIADKVYTLKDGVLV